MDNKKYEEYLDSWLNGIIDEINFWDSFFSTKGALCGAEDVWEEDSAYERQFTLEDDLELIDTKFLDVGSGPYSSCGSLTKKVNLEFYAVDPLASVYKVLKSKHNINTKITPETGMVENLSAKFQENTFDIVHMSNSLDHSFDPMLGIWQMLWVCKQNGKIILRHHQDEAEKENYTGFHQWNLAVRNDRFVIWRGDTIIDIANTIAPYAEIVEVKEDKGFGNKIVIRKINKSPFHFNENFGTLLEKFLEKICDNSLKCFFESKKPVKKSFLKKIFSKKS